FTVTVPVDGADDQSESLTTSEKVMLAAGWLKAMAGAVKVGFAAVALESVTTGPVVCDHWNETAMPVASALALPSSMTSAPDATVWAAPAFATGGAAGGGGGGGCA